MGINTGSIGLRTVMAVVAMLMHVCFASAATGAEAASATRAEITGDQYRTTFQLDLSAGVTAEIYTLANPYRVIVDLPDVEFRLPDGTGQDGHGLVRTFRYGLFAERKARVVLDTREAQVVDIESVMSGLSADSSVVNTEVEVLRSRNLMDRVVAKVERPH